MTQHIDIPDNIAEYIDRHDGVNLNINFNNASADHGYGHMLWHTISISLLTRTCHRCGYDVIWNPNDSESKCQRHSYNNWRYDDVFIWSEFRNEMTLEEAFDKWLSEQPKRYDQPVKKMVFGKIGW